MNYDNTYNLPGLLSDQPQDDNKWKDALRRFQFSGGLDVGDSHMGGGGRVGYQFPVGGGDLTLGASGNMFRGTIDTPEFKDTIRHKQLTGLDASYRKGPNTYGVEWGRGDPMASTSQLAQSMDQTNAFPNMVPQEFIRLFFRRQF
jgi:hypothetical protein